MIIQKLYVRNHAQMFLYYVQQGDILLIAGYIATQKIRELPDKEKSNIPIIAMTTNAFEEDKKQALDAGMDGHISKPIDIDKLKREITSTLTKKLKL